MTEDRVRVLRILEYEGPRSWVEATLAQNAVKGEKRFTKSDELYIIREATIGDTPVILQHSTDDAVAPSVPWTPKVRIIDDRAVHLHRFTDQKGSL
jgi:hypothetical protein